MRRHQKTLASSRQRILFLLVRRKSTGLLYYYEIVVLLVSRRFWTFFPLTDNALEKIVKDQEEFEKEHQFMQV